MTAPRFNDGWMTEEEFRRLDLMPDVTYRTIMRRTDGQVWVAPLGTPDPWPATEADLWVSLDGTTGRCLNCGSRWDECVSDTAPCCDGCHHADHP